MNEAIRHWVERYDCRTRDDYLNALREVLQELALLGLGRARFFEHAAFYGGTALRVLHGLDRYSEDLDFSLLRPSPGFSLETYGAALQREISSFGFEVTFERRVKRQTSAIESAFLKTNTLRESLRVETHEALLYGLHPGTLMKIRLEVDTDPPGGFATEVRYLLQPIPFSVRVCCLPDLLAGKLHAALFRKWGRRVKGRDWYDLVWYAGRHPQLNLSHLEERMRQSGAWTEEGALSMATVTDLLLDAVDRLDVEQARAEVAPFVRDQRALDLWSREFLADVVTRFSAEEGGDR